ncbi:EAL domain-containing protein [Lactobacillus delbrueckii]|nr:EAL domain-containing protein [Lactobacillus delbrueckii]
MDQACRDNWLKIYYQPLIDIQNMKLAECEALSRWIDPRYGFLSPDKFIPALEANREVYKVDCHVLESYGQDAEFLREKGKEIFPISFNISRTDLEACNIYQKIEDTVARYGLSRDQVHIEITESALNDSSQAMVEAVQHFHDLGYQVWMDDFGSGYSSLNVLKDYHFDVIKIDMVFLRKFDDRSKTIVRNICRMAKELGIRTVCEGVETQEQFDFLKEAGCNLAQSSLFSPPVPLDELYKKMAPYL